MGVNIVLRRIKRRNRSRGNMELPDLDDLNFGHFGFAAFQAALASEAGLGDQWQELREAIDKELSLQGDATTPDSAPRESQALAKRIAGMRRKEPLVDFLLLGEEARVPDDVCRRVAPRIRELSANWESAPEGYVGPREKARMLADAMELAGESRDLELFIFD